MRILLVEDDESIREVLKLILETDAPVANLVIDAAASGKEALELAQSTTPDLVLLDLTLPDQHGFEVFKQLKANSSTNLPIVAVSAHAARALEKECLEMGFAAYVAKPIDFENTLFPLLRHYAQAAA